jgi:hypothetical protein
LPSAGPIGDHQLADLPFQQPRIHRVSRSDDDRPKPADRCTENSPREEDHHRSRDPQAEETGDLKHRYSYATDAPVVRQPAQGQSGVDMLERRVSLAAMRP